ncbi:MAG: (d)CMP kinase [Candidatus Bipolaricaulaceae bacterium]
MKVAIDGPAAAGKTTLARRLAAALGCLFVPTGAMYRAAALARARGRCAAQAQIEVRPGGRILLDGEDVTELLDNPELDDLSSQVAVDGRVREHLVARQRQIARGRDVVMEGRDIGTVVLPDADLKIFLAADPQERARRRLRERGGVYAEVLAELRRRDLRDSTRKRAPLRAAVDAVVVDTTDKSPEEVFRDALRLVEERLGFLDRRSG